MSAERSGVLRLLLLWRYSVCSCCWAGRPYPSRPFQHRCDIFSLLNQTKRRQEGENRDRRNEPSLTISRKKSWWYDRLQLISEILDFQSFATAAAAAACHIFIAGSSAQSSIRSRWAVFSSYYYVRMRKGLFQTDEKRSQLTSRLFD